MQDPLALDETLATEVSRIIVMLATFMEAGSADSEAPELDGEEENEEDNEEEEEEWGGIDEEEAEDKEGFTSNITLQTLFTWLSDILIEETRPKAVFLIPKVAAMDIISILLSTLPAASLEPSLEALLTPTAHLTDPSIPIPWSDDQFRTRYEGLKTRSAEAMDALQRKLGTAPYTKALLAVRERSRRRRESRSKKRKIEAVTQPDRFGKWKRGRLDKKVKRRQEKGGEQRARRVAGRYT